MIACIGEDDFGKIMLGKLAKDCIVDGIRKTDEAGTGVAMILNAKDKSKSTTTCAAANDKVRLSAENEFVTLRLSGLHSD